MLAFIRRLGSPVLRRRNLEIIYPLAALAVAIAAWELYVDIAKVPEYLLPSASDTVRILIARLPLLVDEGALTTMTILIGFGASVVFGVVVGLLMVELRWFERTAYPLMVGSQAIPKIALAPIFVVWFGFGPFPRVLMTFLISFFPIVIATVTGLRSIERELQYVSQCMGLSPWKSFRDVRLPHALPHIFAGLKVAITLAVVGAIVGEFVGSDKGLGTVMVRAIGIQNTPLLFAALVAVTVLAIVLFALVGLAERLLIPWHVSQRKD